MKMLTIYKIISIFALAKSSLQICSESRLQMETCNFRCCGTQTICRRVVCSNEDVSLGNGYTYELEIKAANSHVTLPPGTQIVIFRMEHTQAEDVDLSRNDNIEQLHLAHNKLIKLKKEIVSGRPFLKIADLSFNRINFIEEFPSGGRQYLELRELYLNNNNVTHIESEFLNKFPSLTTLDVSSNPLKNLNSDLCAALKSLSVLNMTNTNLDEIDVMKLAPCSKLTELVLRRNLITNLHKGMFSNMEELEILDASFNSVSELYNPFANNNKLKKLLLNNNNIRNLTKRIFDPLVYLSHLDVSSNPLAHIDQLLLGNLKELVFLNISNSNIEDDFKFSDTYMNRLQILDVSHNKLTKVTSNKFLNFNKIIYIDLSNNNIDYVDNETISNMIFLKGIRLNGNKIDKIPNPLFRYGLELDYFDISRNPIENIPSSIFEYCTELGEIYLNAVNIEKYNLKIKVNTRKTIIRFSISGNRLSEITSEMFSNFSSLTYLDISFNLIQHLDSQAFLDLNQLETLNVSSNHLESLSSTQFRDMTSLKYLDLSGNNLRKLAAGTFDSCGHLLVMNLSYNQLETLDEYSLYPLKNLEALYVQKNKISKIEGVNHLTHLKNLSLQDNPWNCRNLLTLVKTINFRENRVNMDADSQLPLAHHIQHISCDHREINLNLPVSQNYSVHVLDLEEFKKQLTNLVGSMNVSFKHALSELESSRFNPTPNRTENNNPPQENTHNNSMFTHSLENFKNQMNNLLGDININFKSMLTELEKSKSMMIPGANKNIPELLSRELIPNTSAGSLVSPANTDKNTQVANYFNVFIGLGIILSLWVIYYIKSKKRKIYCDQQDQELIETRI